MSQPVATKRQLEVVDLDELKKFWRDSMLTVMAIGVPALNAMTEADGAARAYASMVEDLAIERGTLQPRK